MYTFRGIDDRGEIRSGLLDVKDKAQAFRTLKIQGIRPLEIKKLRQSKSLSIAHLFRVPDEEISYLLLRLSIMLSSGLTLTQALATIHSQGENRKIAHAVLTIKEEIERGESISSAFKKAEIFPDFIVEMLRVAERGKNLEQILSLSSEFLSKTSEIKNRIFNSLTYPALVILLSFISVVLVVNLIIPRIAQVLGGLGKELPIATKILLSLSSLIGYSIYFMPILIIFFVLRHRFFNRKSLSKLWLNVPLFGKLTFLFDLSRFSRMLSMSLSSGIPILRSIELSVASMSSYYLRESLKDVVKNVAKGESISSVLSNSRVFPETFINLVTTGEKSGEIEKMLILLSEIYDRQALRLINLWLRFIEPLTILVIGVMVASIALSIILPLTEISTGIKR